MFPSHDPSGEYSQTQGRLCRETKSGKTSFCCLGVLVNEVEGFADHPGYGHVKHAGSLRRGFLKEVGLSIDAQGELVCMNDGCCDYPKRRFSTIANWIEENL